MHNAPLTRNTPRSEQLLFLTDDQIRQGIETLFFAYRDITGHPDKILENYSYGRAHHRVIHFVNRKPGLTVNELLDILGVTKQSLNRVLRQLVDDGLIDSRIGKIDRRQRNLYLTDTGVALEKELSDVQRKNMRRAYSAAGPDAVQGFRTVLEAMIQPEVAERMRNMLQGPNK